MSVGAECLEIARTYNNQNSFLNSINPSVRDMISQGAKKYRIASVLLKSLNNMKMILTMLQKPGKNY